MLIGFYQHTSLSAFAITHHCEKVELSERLKRKSVTAGSGKQFKRIYRKVMGVEAISPNNTNFISGGFVLMMGWPEPLPFTLKWLRRIREVCLSMPRLALTLQFWQRMGDSAVFRTDCQLHHAILSRGFISSISGYLHRTILQQRFRSKILRWHSSCHTYY